MKTKQIVFTRPNTAEILEKDIQPPAAGQVQVRLLCSTISSGTERANLTGDANVSPGGNAVPFPRMLGYSSAGVVQQVGEGVSSLKVGDRVAMAWTVHSQLVNVPEACAYLLPDSVSFSDGALFHIAAFPLAALRKCRLEIGESAVVMGQGVLGLLALPLLRAAGAIPIIAVDPVAEKRAKALSAGADVALDPFAEDFADTAREITGGGARVGIEVTGFGAGLDGILDCMGRFGRVALLGCTRNKEFSIDYYRKVHAPGITLVGAHTMARPGQESHPGWWTQGDDILTVLRLTQAGRIRLSSLVDEVCSPAQAPAVYARLAVEKAFPLVQFDWRDFE